MGIIAIITIVGFVIAIIYLRAIKTELEAIRRMAEMSEQERTDYNMSVDEPELYDDILIARDSQRREEMKAKK